MTVNELLQKLEPSDMLRIIKGENELYCGYLGMIEYHDKKSDSFWNENVKKFRAIPEITHKKWKELGLVSPLRPLDTPQFSFSELQMRLYYTVYI